MALLFESFGSADMLQFPLPDPPVPPGQLQLAMRAIGLNFADIHGRRAAFLQHRP